MFCKGHRGFAALLAITAPLLSGCVEWNAGVSAATSYASGQVSIQQANIQAANDVVAKTTADAMCATPYGEVSRNGSGNPNFAQAVIALCGAPSGFTMIHTSGIATATTTIPTTVIVAPAPVAK